MSEWNGALQLGLALVVVGGGIFVYFKVVQPAIKCISSPVDCLQANGPDIGKRGANAVTSGFMNIGGDWSKADKSYKAANGTGEKAGVVGRAALDTLLDVSPIGMLGRFIKG